MAEGRPWQAGIVFERYSDRSRRVLVHARDEARRHRHGQIGVEHLLLGLLHDADDLAATALGSLGVSLDAARARVPADPSSEPPAGRPPFTQPAKQVLERAHQRSLTAPGATVTTRHLLLGLLDVEDASSSRLLGSFGATAAEVRAALAALPHEEPALPHEEPALSDKGPALPRDGARPGASVAPSEDRPWDQGTGRGTLDPAPARASPPRELPAALVGALARRGEALPVSRIRRGVDYWALRRVEERHVERLARQHRLDEPTRDLARDWWLAEVRRCCASARGQLSRREQGRLRRTMRHGPFRPTAVFQLYWHTVGPGARTWFADRYASIRRYPFRMRRSP